MRTWQVMEKSFGQALVLVNQIHVLLVVAVVNVFEVEQEEPSKVDH